MRLGWWWVADGISSSTYENTEERLQGNQKGHIILECSQKKNSIEKKR